MNKDWSIYSFKFSPLFAFFWNKSLALIKITKSPYHMLQYSFIHFSLALIKITKSPYLQFVEVYIIQSLALIKITKSPYPL